MRTLLRLALAAALLAAPAALASPLDDAKRDGQLGEQADGYVGVVPGAPPGAGDLAQRINAERSARYADLPLTARSLIMVAGSATRHVGRGGRGS